MKCRECIKAQVLNDKTVYCKDGRCYGYRHIDSECIFTDNPPKTETDTLKAIVSHYGFGNQAMVLAEECGELIQAVSKVSRGCTDYKNLIKELGDVLFMSKQIMAYLGIEETDVLDVYKRNLQERLQEVSA